jgi:poly-gamma-glutamate synthesis protein (capsule biosynthesis protein)
VLKCLVGLALYGAAPASWSSGDRRVTRSPGEDGVTLFLCGDVMTGRGIDQILPHPVDPRIFEPYMTDARDYVALAESVNGPVDRPVDLAYIWGDALAELGRVAPDARIVNLETAVTTSETPRPKGINYRMHPENIGCLTAARIDCCTLANNHVLDWGYDGFEETLATLETAGILYAGAGRNLAGARAPAVIALPGNRRVLVFGLGSASSGIGWQWGAAEGRAGVNLLDDLSEQTVRTVAEQVAAHKARGDIAVASIHWGGNWGYDIPHAHRAFAHALVDRAGIDLVHGHSSHHVKGIEVYRDRLILYGCGDFINDYEGISGMEEFRGDLGLMYFPLLDPATGRLRALAMTPTRLRNLRVNRASPSESTWLADVLNREGRALGTRVTAGDDGRLSLEWPRAGGRVPRAAEAAG